MPKKQMGGAKGHIAGGQVTGGHTTVIDGADKIVKKLAGKDWFVSIQPLEIHADKSVGGGAQFVAIRRYNNSLHENTLTLTFKKAGIVQKMNLRVNNLAENIDTVVADITQVVARQWHGAQVHNRVGDIAEEELPAPAAANPEGEALLAKWGIKRAAGRER